LWAITKQPSPVPPPPAPGALGTPAPGTAPPTVELHEIHDAVHIPSVWDWLTPTLIGVTVAALALWLWWRFRNKKSATEKIRESAADRARKRLSGVVREMGDPERFCTVLSEIVRVYLEERFRIRAPEQTTEEFLADTQKNSILDQKHRDLLAGFLEQCDLVKFAGYEPVREDLERLHRSASDFVEETAFELPTLAEAVKQGGGR
jgi:hypothetical protein